MEGSGKPVYPYEFDPEKRARSKELSRTYFRLNVASTLSGAFLILLILLTGASERYSLLLGMLPWPFAAAIYTSTLITAFFILEACFSYMRLSLRRKYGVSTQSRGRWLEDQAKGYLATVALSTAAVEFLFLVIDVEPGLWWLIIATAFIALGVCYSTLFPLLFARFFYRIRPLPEGDALERVMKLLSKLGLERLQVFTLNESTRSRSANAFVTGIGKGKKVVLFDNLLSTFVPQEVDSIVAHELGHYVRKDTSVSMLIGFATAYAASFIMYLTAGMVLRGGLVHSILDPGLLLWFVLSVSVFEFALSPLMNLLSRRREAKADLFSLNLTCDPAAFISGEKRLCDINMMDESVSRLRRIFFATHPSTLERIAMGENWKPPAGQ